MFNSALIEKAKVFAEKDVSTPNVQRVSMDIYVIEEMAELTKELTKIQRRKGNPRHVEEEAADVLAALLIYSVANRLDFDRLAEVMNYKLDRGIARLDNGEQ